MRGVYGNIDDYRTRVMFNWLNIFTIENVKVMNDKELNLLHINPGAAGKSGFHKVITMLRFQIDGSEIKNMELYEKKRIR